MICKKCNVEIPNDSAFCPECGAPCEVEEVKEIEETEAVVEETEEKPAAEKAEAVIEESAPAFEEPVKVEKPAKKKGSVTNIIGIVIGVLCMVFGVVSFLTATHGLDTASFGADFYTYTYDGIFAAAQLLQIIAKVCSLLLVGAGYCMVYFFGKKK